MSSDETAIPGDQMPVLVTNASRGEGVSGGGETRPSSPQRIFFSFFLFLRGTQCSTPQSRLRSNFFITFQPNFYHKIPILHTSINDFTTFTTFYHIFCAHKRNEHKILSRRKDSEQSCESNENPLRGHSKRVYCYNFAFKTFTKVIPGGLFWAQKSRLGVVVAPQRDRVCYNVRSMPKYLSRYSFGSTLHSSNNCPPHIYARIARSYRRKGR